MGSRGIKRRKPERPAFPRLHAEVRDGGELPSTEPPGVMWPTSGFEASASSPAGEIAGLSRFARGITGMRGRKPPLAATLAAAVIIGFRVAVVVVLIVSG